MRWMIRRGLVVAVSISDLFLALRIELYSQTDSSISNFFSFCTRQLEMLHSLVPSFLFKCVFDCLGRLTSAVAALRILNSYSEQTKSRGSP